VLLGALGTRREKPSAAANPHCANMQEIKEEAVRSESAAKPSNRQSRRRSSQTSEQQFVTLSVTNKVRIIRETLVSSSTDASFSQWFSPQTLEA